MKLQGKILFDSGLVPVTRFSWVEIIGNQKPKHRPIDTLGDNLNETPGNLPASCRDYHPQFIDSIHKNADHTWRLQSQSSIQVSFHA